jgi:hypothetical protein
MHCHIYLRKGMVIIPTSGSVHRGLHRDVEPVAAVAASDTDAVRRALLDTIARGNPLTAYYSRGTYPQPVVLKYAGVKTWSAFARGTSNWTIKEKDGRYQIVGYKMHPDGWVEDPEQITSFAVGTTLDDVVDRAIEIVQEAARDQVHR